MTKEELKKEAEESFEQYKVTDEDYVVSPYSDDMGEKMLMFNYEYEAEEDYLRLYTQGYLAGAEPREKRIAELEAEVKEWKDKADLWCKTANLKDHNIMINKELEKENAELKAQIKKMKMCAEWQIGIPIKKWEIFARTVTNCNLLATYFDGAWRNVWNGGIIDFDKITMWRYTGFKNNGEEIDFKELAE